MVTSAFSKIGRQMPEARISNRPARDLLLSSPEERSEVNNADERIKLCPAASSALMKLREDGEV
jgi:hypothetical protein